MIDLDKLDPDWVQASQHGQASKTGIIPDKRPSGTLSICHCCFNVVYKDPPPLCANSKEL